MANQWFRMYSDFLNDPKMVSLAFEDQRHFIGVLALKSDGTLDQKCDEKLRDRIIAQRLWIDYAILSDVKKRLVNAGLISDSWQPLAWEKRQFVSDNSSERVRRFREKKASVSGNVSETLQKRPQITDTDTDTDTEADTEADTEEETETEAEKVKTPNDPEGQETADLLLTVNKQVISDFTAIRKAKKAPLTETALKGIKREADKIGYTLEQALTTCCERGWAGFKADWILKEQAQAAKVPISKEQEKREATERARARVFGANPIEKDITHEATRL